MHKTALTAALALLLTLPALGQKVDLRGPAPTAGETYTTTTKTTAKSGNLDITAQGQQFGGKMEIQSTHVIDVKVLEVSDGQPTKVESKFTQAVSKTKTTMLGQEQEQEDKTMQGVVMTQTKDDDGWHTTMAGNDAIPEQAKDIVKNAGYVDPRLIFPADEVAVGDKWMVDNDKLQFFMGQSGIPGAKIKGDILCKLIEIKTIEGKQIAVIDYQMDATLTFDMSPDPNMSMAMTITMSGNGKLNRNLTDWTTDQDFTGDYEMDMTTTVNGQQAMTMSAKMPADVVATQQRK